MDPDMDDYPERGCPGCSMYADQLSNLLHLRERDTRFVAVGRGEQEHLQRYRKHMGASRSGRAATCGPAPPSETSRVLPVPRDCVR
jgi:predicted dithiol-disulfide oxidoreductase (DUF899 family)